LCFLKNDKSYSLVTRLSKQCGQVASVDSSESLGGNNLPYSVEEVLILRVRGEFIMDKLGLKSFLRGNHECRLSCSSGNTAEETIHFRLLSKNVALEVSESSESHVVLGN